MESVVTFDSKHDYIYSVTRWCACCKRKPVYHQAQKYCSACSIHIRDLRMEIANLKAKIKKMRG